MFFCCSWCVHAKSDMCTKLSCDLVVMFLVSFALFRAFGHRWGMVVSGHWCVACKIMILDLSCKSWIRFSVPPILMMCIDSRVCDCLTLILYVVNTGVVCKPFALMVVVNVDSYLLAYCLSANFPFSVSLLDASSWRKLLDKSKLLSMYIVAILYHFLVNTHLSCALNPAIAYSKLSIETYYTG